MVHILKNENVEIQLHGPSNGYQLPRFDWTGKILAVKYKGRFVSGMELNNPPRDFSYGQGFYNEFGIERPIGFSDINSGEWFHKIGVGLLQKEGEEYQFHKHYPIQMADFSVVSSQEAVSIICKAPEVSGYAYILQKQIQLVSNGFSIHYQLQNTGLKSIQSDEYNHNFLAIDQQLIGPEYVLTFPFQIQASLFGETVNPEQLVLIGQQTIQFRGTPKEPFFFSNLSGSKSVVAEWTLVNQKSKIGITESGDFLSDKINLWGWGHVISPELFYDIDVAPGETVNWTRNYQIFEL